LASSKALPFSSALIAGSSSSCSYGSNSGSSSSEATSVAISSSKEAKISSECSNNSFSVRSNLANSLDSSGFPSVT